MDRTRHWFPVRPAIPPGRQAADRNGMRQRPPSARRDRHRLQSFAIVDAAHDLRMRLAGQRLTVPDGGAPPLQDRLAADDGNRHPGLCVT
ncbi:hypothetical protein H5V43_17680 [Sphingobium fuliginis]|uniref:Uncharacterized protein n=1 Tax=Sphingobium fuliginis (strain ATCC 27551) TaxID=336203 RepID=A0A7M2GPW4_SPHSA|nr:hypothetical protein [Sphingobium fuliginis]QOT73979.1 hypothetical protein H5V43_17680 [Sphingobium fuliginis]